MADFEVDVTAWVKKQQALLPQIFAATAMAFKTRLQELTPVVTGRLRASWQVSTDSLDNSSEDFTNLSASLSSPLPGGRIVIGTNVVYARRVEFGFVGQDSLGRHFNQQGRHMMQQTITEGPQIVAQVVSDLKGAS
jgi:hypothetical protein